MAAVDATVAPLVAMAMSVSAIAVGVAVPKDLHQGHVDEEAQGADAQHVRRIDFLQIVKAVEGLQQQARSQGPNDRHGKQCAEDLRLLESIGVLLGDALNRQLQANERDDEASDIRQHVCCVRDDRE
mmetsp:Transcript_3146/g.6551  ORF Transcript_3146/g.6551 Transcript_3146/m.6551 type:complete len:127 (+) Transcript_3146:715-1095(+)